MVSRAKKSFNVLISLLFLSNNLIALAQCLSDNNNHAKLRPPSLNTTALDDGGGGENLDSTEQEEKIVSKITFVVAEEEQQQEEQSNSEPPVVSTTPKPKPISKTTLTTNEKTVNPKCSEHTTTERVEPRFYLDESTKLIYINGSNESGYLIGEINNSFEDSQHGNFSSKHQRAHGSSNLNKSSSSSNLLLDSRLEKGREGSNPTNYSIYLISRHKEHIAILLDIEEIDFEPIINCEYQELRFSIVGEISKQLLNRSRNGGEKGNSGNAERAGSVNDDMVDFPQDASGTTETIDINQAANGNDGAAESSTQDGGANSESYVPPLPVSEAMAMLLNSPLNMTILDDSEETNEFKIIDSTIDYLHSRTCHELRGELETERKSRIEHGQEEHHQQVVETVTGGNNKRGRSRPRQSHESVPPSKRRMMRQRGRSKGQENSCPDTSKHFKDMMSRKLDDHFEWDDFKIICGKTKQLVIPMRSLKLSVYSDEFSLNSRFVLHYRFISDPNLLPAKDNGKYYCRNRNVIDLAQKCNGIDDCGDASDESIKVCGYPTGRANEPASVSTSQQQSSSQNGSHSIHHSNSSNKKKRLTYFNGDVLHCCQSQDWMSVVSHSQSNHMLNLPGLISESMSLFSGPLFAPTRSSSSSSFTGHRRRRVKRIVGGRVAQKGGWPGQVSLQYELLEPLCHFCAGTLIHPQYVITAGHCITKAGLNRGIKVILGAHDLRQLGSDNIQERYVDDALIYPGVDVRHLSFDWENDMNNDIALLRLNAPVLITPHVAPACLPPFNNPLSVNTSCRSIGWGQTHGSGSSNLLKHLPLKVVNSSLCSKELLDRDLEDGEGNLAPGMEPDGKDKNDEWWDKTRKGEPVRGGSIERRNRRLVGDFETSDAEQFSNLTMVCVNNDKGHGICQGDSGGPLYCDRVMPNGEHCTEIYGVASFIIQYATVGAMCAVENLPGIFGEVSSKTEWISSTIKMFEQTYRLKYS